MEKQNQTKNKRRFSATVVSDKMQKTRVVTISLSRVHPVYLKHFKIRRRIKVHDEKGEAKTGDRVLIEETRPLSKDKHFRIIKILKDSS